MSLHSKTRLFAVLATALAFFASFSGTLSAAWEKVQDCPTVYRDTRTNLEWTVTLGSVCSNAQAQSLVQKYGFRLPTPSELQYVINCNCGACQLCLYDGRHNAYETSNPCAQISIRRGCAVVTSKRGCQRTWVVGVRETPVYIIEDYEPLPVDEPEPETEVTADPTGKIYILNVWGTTNYEIGTSLQVMEKRFASVMSNQGLGEYSEEVGEYITLDGNPGRPKASKDNVLAQCRYLSEKATENDAIFVYIACHGSTKEIVEGQREHVLYPGVVTASDGKNRFEKFGLLRSDVIKALNANKHRLVVLITDSCSVKEHIASEVLDSPLIKSFAKRSAYELEAAYDESQSDTDITQSYLKNFLMNGEGFVNWNSCSPVGGNKREGEESIAIVIKDGEVFSPFFEAFLETSTYQVRYNERVSRDNYFVGMKKLLSRNFNNMKKGQTKWGDYKYLKMAIQNQISQNTQTLYDFKESGVVTEYISDEDELDGNVPDEQNETGEQSETEEPKDADDLVDADAAKDAEADAAKDAEADAAKDAEADAAKDADKKADLTEKDIEEDTSVAFGDDNTEAVKEDVKKATNTDEVKPAEEEPALVAPTDDTSY